MGPALQQVKRFPASAREAAGFQLWRLQVGLAPNDWKPMPSIGRGVAELRIHTTMEHRLIYVAGFAEAVYVLHAFAKRSRSTSRKDLDLARRRLRILIESRAQEFNA